MPRRSAATAAALVAIAAVWLGLAVYSAMSDVHAYFALWLELIPVPEFPPFADTALLTKGLDCLERGIDPRVQNPCDLAQRIVSYPWIWLELRHLGIGGADTVAVALSFIALFGLAFVASLRRIDPIDTLWLLPFAFAPATLLAIDRANIDIVVFAVTAGALAFAERRRDVAAAATLVLGFVLKIVPLAAGVALLRAQSRRGWFGLVACGLAAALYLVVFRDDFAYLRAHVPQFFQIGYGRPVFATHLGWWAFGGLAPAAWEWIGNALVFVTAAAAAAAGARVTLAPSDAPERSAFVAGASIFVITYLGGTNFDYRLVFTFFVLPQLFAWRRGPHPRRRAWANATFFALLAAFLTTGSVHGESTAADVVSLTNEVLNLAVFALFTAGLSAHLRGTLPTALASLRDASRPGSPPDHPPPSNGYSATSAPRHGRQWARVGLAARGASRARSSAVPPRFPDAATRRRPACPSTRSASSCSSPWCSQPIGAPGATPRATSYCWPRASSSTPPGIRRTCCCSSVASPRTTAASRR